jgi:hypothetical protein
LCRKKMGKVKYLALSQWNGVISSMMISVLGWRRAIYAIVVFILQTVAHAQVRPQNPYPNELKDFKFYERYLSPLRPYISEKAEIVQTLGTDQVKDLPGWRVFISFVGEYDLNTVNGRRWAHNISGRLASLELKPRKHVSMSRVKFSPAFTHSYGSVSEMNVKCDVYSDDSGLEYWIYAENSKVGKKGDLMRIVYGPSERLKHDIVGEK